MDDVLALRKVFLIEIELTLSEIAKHYVFIPVWDVTLKFQLFLSSSEDIPFNYISQFMNTLFRSLLLNLCGILIPSFNNSFTESILEIL